MQLREQGEGSAVLLCHSFPETSYAWRHQLLALAAAGFHAVAPDLRGYGGTASPADIDQYNLLQLIGDSVGILDALGVVVGNDWRATVDLEAIRIGNWRHSKSQLYHVMRAQAKCSIAK